MVITVQRAAECGPALTLRPGSNIFLHVTSTAIIDSNLTPPPFFLHVFFFFLYTSTFQLLLDKPWSQVSSLLPPGSCLQFLSRIGFSNPTAH